MPTHSSHKTYLIVEKIDKKFNLFWTNRPTVLIKKNLNLEETLGQIQSMLNERFPFMDIEKVMHYPVISKQPMFSEPENYATIKEQGNYTNCVVSNLFGMLETIDKIRGEDIEITKLRNTIVRKSLEKSYGFYESGFDPFILIEKAYCLKELWNNFKASQDDPI